MPLPAPSPLDALRLHSRAVILTAEGVLLSDALTASLRQAGIAFDAVDHPLIAMAALTHAVRSVVDDQPPALVVSERQIDDLGELFSTIRARLPRAAIWVFEADIAIEVQRGIPSEPASRPSHPPSPPPSLSARPSAPALRIAEPDRDPRRDVDGFANATEEPGEEAPPEPSGSSVTAEELEMLLDLFKSEDGKSNDRKPRGDGGLR